MMAVLLMSGGLQVSCSKIFSISRYNDRCVWAVELAAPIWFYLVAACQFGCVIAGWRSRRWNPWLSVVLLSSWSLSFLSVCLFRLAEPESVKPAGTCI